MWKRLAEINDAIDSALKRKTVIVQDADKKVYAKPGPVVEWDINDPNHRAEILAFVKRPGNAEKYGITEAEIKSLEELDNIQDPAEFHAHVMQMGETQERKPEVDESTLDEVLAELDALIGLESVKEEVHTLVNFIKVQKAREEAGLPSSNISYHCVFTGSPGTGKTTVARLVTKIYKHLGILKTGHLVETDRSGLVAEYSGQTAVKTNKLIDSALDGILFIDEAYALVGEGQDDYGKEAVATLLKRMEDDRKRLVLVVAGYQENMKDFISANPGLKSRFNRYIEFPDYTPEELMKIFELFCKKSEYKLYKKAKERLMEVFQELYDKKDEHFGNGRLARNMFEQIIENHSNRIVESNKEQTKRALTTILVEDIPDGQGE